MKKQAKGPKFRVGDKVRLDACGRKVETIRAVFWDASYDGIGTWRYLIVGEGDHWVPVEEVVKSAGPARGRRRTA